MSNTQKLINIRGDVYDERPILAGPHEWEVGGERFKTVLVKCKEDKPGKLSVIETGSCARMGYVEVRAPKTRPTQALQATSNLITQLIAQIGEKNIAKAVRDRKIK